mmetsp:Transcript_19588/g.60570  ORF Transcript_19588/g.60570 Transcript_19588/m.60570 type:complete len:236 (-) Transcript_19588:3129-3836(-)
MPRKTAIRDGRPAPTRKEASLLGGGELLGEGLVLGFGGGEELAELLDFVLGFGDGVDAAAVVASAVVWRRGAIAGGGAMIPCLRRRALLALVDAGVDGEVDAAELVLEGGVELGDDVVVQQRVEEPLDGLVRDLREVRGDELRQERVQESAVAAAFLEDVDETLAARDEVVVHRYVLAVVDDEHHFRREHEVGAFALDVDGFYLFEVAEHVAEVDVEERAGLVEHDVAVVPVRDA